MQLGCLLAIALVEKLMIRGTSSLLPVTKQKWNSNSVSKECQVFCLALCSFEEELIYMPSRPPVLEDVTGPRCSWHFVGVV